MIRGSQKFPHSKGLVLTFGFLYSIPQYRTHECLLSVRDVVISNWVLWRVHRITELEGALQAISVVPCVVPVGAMAPADVFVGVHLLLP